MPRSNLVPHTETLSGREFTLWGETDTLDNFISGLTPDTAAAETFTTQSVDGHTRKRYPGDPGISVSSHNRTVSSDRGIEGSPNTPGRRVWFERSTGIGPLKVTVVRQATYTGSFRALKEYCEANRVGLDFTLRRESGRAFVMAAPVVP